MTETVLQLFPDMEQPEERVLNSGAGQPGVSWPVRQSRAMTGEYMAAAELCRMGYLVSMSCENSPYDLVVDTVGENRVLTRNRTG